MISRWKKFPAGVRAASYITLSLIAIIIFITLMFWIWEYVLAAVFIGGVVYMVGLVLWNIMKCFHWIWSEWTLTIQEHESRRDEA